VPHAGLLGSIDNRPVLAGMRSSVSVSLVEICSPMSLL